MRPARSLLTAMALCALLIGARPMAGNEQFPHGLMSSEPRGGDQGGSCRIETRPLAFGPYDALASVEVDATGQIIYICGGGNGGDATAGRGGGPGARAQNRGIRIELDEGLSNAYLPRHMFGPDPGGLEYNIYLDPTHRTVWGNGQGSTEVYFDLNPPIRTPVTVLLYGRIFRSQNVEAGAYFDEVAVRIQF